MLRPKNRSRDRVEIAVTAKKRKVVAATASVPPVVATVSVPPVAVTLSVPSAKTTGSVPSAATTGSMPPVTTVEVSVATVVETKSY